MKKDDLDKEFKVEDRRRFDAEGNAKEGDEKENHEVKNKSEKAAESEGASFATEKDMPPIDFATFVLSLASSAHIHLGIIPNPATNKTEESLTHAKQTIDILGMIQEKTKGNLKDYEDKLLTQILYELRMQYVEKKGK